MNRPPLVVAHSLGNTVHVGFHRRDLSRVFHTIMTGAPGSIQTPDTHFPCEVCAEHNVSMETVGPELDKILGEPLDIAGAVVQKPGLA